MCLESEGQSSKEDGAAQRELCRLADGSLGVQLSRVSEEMTPGWGRTTPKHQREQSQSPPRLGKVPHPTNHSRFHHLCSIKSNSQRVLPKY